MTGTTPVEPGVDDADGGRLRRPRSSRHPGRTTTCTQSLAALSGWRPGRLGPWRTRLTQVAGSRSGRSRAPTAPG